MVKELLEIQQYKKDLNHLLKRTEESIVSFRENDVDYFLLEQVISSLTGVIEETKPYVKPNPRSHRFEPLIYSGSADIGISTGDLMLEGIREDYIRTRELCGEARMFFGRFDEAVNDLTEAIELGSKNYLTLYLCGYSNWVLGRFEKALANLTEAMKIAPQQPDAYTLYATVLENTGRYREALDYVNKAIQINPKHQNALHIRGLLYLRLNEFERSIKDSKRAVDIDSEDSASCNNLGNAYLKMGRFDEAISYLRESIRLNPEAPQPYSHLGRAYQCIGDRVNAQRHYKTALKLAHGIEANLKNKNQLLAAIGAERGLNEMGIKIPIWFEDKALSAKVLTAGEIKDYLSNS